MTDKRTRETLVLGLAAFLHLAILGPRMASAWVPTCGGTPPAGNQTITGTFSLNCPTPVNGCLLTLSNSTNLNLAGLALSCTPGSGQTGICITAPGARVTGPGMVTNCATAISTSSQGNVVRGVTTMGNDFGIVELATASGNGFLQNTVMNSTQNGILALGGPIKIVQNVLIANGIGIRLQGTNNYASTNTVLSSVGDGILAAMTTGSYIVKNRLYSNNTSDNAASAGIHVTSTSSGVRVRSNLGIGNINSLFPPGFLNFRDDSVGCGTNFWAGNNVSVPPLAYTPACAT